MGGAKNRTLNRTIKIIFWLSTPLIGFCICVIGIPSRLLSGNIDEQSMARIKEANGILIAAQLKALKATADGSRALPLEYGHITEPDQVGRIFPFLSDSDKNKIITLFDKHDVDGIDFQEQNCISYFIKSSSHSVFINSSYEELHLIYNNHCDCNCETSLYHSDEVGKKQNAGNGWLKVYIVIPRARIQG